LVLYLWRPLAVRAAYAQPAPVKPLPPFGPTPDEVAAYARAQAQYHSGLASDNGDVFAQATNTFSLVASEILSRQDPSLFDARLVCDRYRVGGPRDDQGLRSTYKTQFVQDCQRVDGRYNQETIAIRRDLAARMPAERATVAQAGAGQP
jgi:hypothetical protein